MTSPSSEQLTSRHCVPCEGGVPPVDRKQAEGLLENLPGWSLTHDAKRIRKDWVVKNFLEGIGFFQRVAALAEDEGHHPDLHLEGYRHVWIEIWTHAIGGLSENDFILAAKIDQLPVLLKKG